MTSDPMVKASFHIICSVLFALVMCPSISTFAISLPLVNKPVVLDAHEESIRYLYATRQTYMTNDSELQGGYRNWKAGGINAVWIAAWVNPERHYGKAAVQRTMALIDYFNTIVASSNHKLVFCETASDVRKAVNDNKIALLLAVEGGVSLNNDLDMIREYRKLGVRRINLCWNGDLDWVGSAYAKKGGKLHITGKGLNEFGIKVVKEMNNNGIVIDCSHASDQTIRDVLRVTSKPIICSHSNCRALSAVPRNLPDDLIINIAKNGGVIGINFYPPHLQSKGGRPNVDTVVAHINHVVKLAGIDHVGIGSDFDGIEETMPQLSNASKFPGLVKSLKQHGYSDTDLKKILGENFLRVLEQNE